MVHRLRLRPHVEEYVVGWGATAAQEDRELIAEFMETLADGSWDTRWYRDPDQSHERPGLPPRPFLPDREWTVVWPDEGLAVVMQIDQEPDAADRHLDTWVEEIRIVRVDRNVDDTGLPAQTD